MDHRLGRRALRRWLIWLLIGIVALVVLGVALAVLPRLLAPRSSFGNAADAVRAQHEERALILQGLGGLALLLGAYITWRQFQISREQLQLNLRATAQQLQATQDQLTVARQSQITERFTRAMDQLGSDQLVVRLGGIYALERIAKDSPADAGIIAGILCSYLRQHAPAPDTPTAGSDVPHLVARAPDVQAALTVLVRRAARPDDEEPLRLIGVDLRRADLTKADLAGADLEGAHLNWAWLPDARLDGADLNDADLSEANLAGASLKGVDLAGAVLHGAHLEGASLREAELGGAQLDGAVANEATTWPDGFEPRQAGVNVRRGHSSDWWRT
ncbi:MULTISPECIES: pentapeptide repeat-containing protein [unclassified Streptomyces]|uniref:pentapeptide repeat-containing protein n=1 Tax=unclassified Streptomyces TaxID=2593676 RepID=UPI002366CA7C|nr:MULTISPECIES: pentapeptide repeat-containing protein [unclassified Streptomyces]MDF3146454.1 pentapeptide repeat-containing protein [Streptomyces sp. T21Q-yed]WDF43369.1 pentapeptide repeat-containing protein [Streptomyces sp. T12]